MYSRKFSITILFWFVTLFSLMVSAKKYLPNVVIVIAVIF